MISGHTCAIQPWPLLRLLLYKRLLAHGHLELQYYPQGASLAMCSHDN